MSFIGKGLNKIFGGDKAGKTLKSFDPSGFSSPGLTGSFDKNTNTFNLNRTGEANQALTDLRGGFDNLSSEIGGLRKDVKPGFGRLTRTLIEGIRNRGAKVVGNLREELSKRRVAGSSFAEREIASQESEFIRQEEEVRAQAFLQELQLTRDLIDDQFKASIAGAASVLEQLNFESGIAARLGDSASRQLQANNVAQAEAQSASAAGNAQFVATIASAFIFASDRRLKTNIRRIGIVNGYPWYEFDYIWGEHSQGVMSDEVPARHVVNIVGYDYVKYQEIL